MLALSRGGRYTLGNIVPACRACNTSKCNDEVTTWLRRKGFDEQAFLLRHLEIGSRPGTIRRANAPAISPNSSQPTMLTVFLLECVARLLPTERDPETSRPGLA